MITIARLSITPVKGLALQYPDEATLTLQGVEENRRFYLADRVGSLVSAPDHPPLVQIRPEYDAQRERLRLTFPDGTIVEGSAQAGEESVTSDFYGRPVRGNVVPDGALAEALTCYVGKPVRLVRPGPGDACDVHHVTVVSDASVEELRRRAGRPEPVDARRFRMLMDLSGCEPHEEDGWEGLLIQIGDVRVRVRGPVPRCHLTTRDPDTGERDFDALREIKNYRGLRGRKHIDFGVYGDVERPGRVRVGDEVHVQGEAQS